MLLNDPEIDALFTSTPIVDGLLNPYLRKDLARVDDTERVQDFNTVRRTSGVDIGVFSLSSNLNLLEEQAAYVQENSTSLVIETSADIDRALETGTYGVIFYTQKHFPLQGSVEPIREWYAKSLRILQLAYGVTWDPDNAGPEEKLAGGGDEPDLGLTDMGREAIALLNELHMMIDVSHLSRPAVLETTALSKEPVLATHACSAAITEHRRNKTDEELRAISETGGVIGATPIGWMLDRDGDGKADIDDFVAHINQMVNAAGIDHIGLASDAILDGWEPTSRHYADKELAAVDRWKRVTRKLISVQDRRGKRKYSDDDLKKILGLNFLRVFRGVLV